MATVGAPLPPLLLLALAILGALAGLGLLLAHLSPLARRARALGAGPHDLPGLAARSPGRLALALLLPLASWLQARLGAIARHLPDPGRKLDEAGHRSVEARALFLVAPFLLSPALTVTGGLFLPLVAEGLSPLAGALLGGGLGAALPFLWLHIRIIRRQQAIRAGFPDMLDLFLICIEAGLSLDAAMARVARELAPALPELADELHLTSIELGFLPNRADAFTHLERRVPIEETRNLVALFQQTERYGTPLAAALRTQAAEARNAALMRVEERAARLPAILTVPMILFILPPLFIVLIGPVIVQLLAM